MGYRSKVVIALNNKVIVDNLVKNNLPSLLKEADRSVEIRGPFNDKLRYIIYEFESIKWYDSYFEVTELETFISELDDSDYGFIRVGEDTDDITFNGSPLEYNMSVMVDICY